MNWQFIWLRNYYVHAFVTVNGAQFPRSVCGAAKLVKMKPTGGMIPPFRFCAHCKIVVEEAT